MANTCITHQKAALIDEEEEHNEEEEVSKTKPAKPKKSAPPPKTQKNLTGQKGKKKAAPSDTVTISQSEFAKLLKKATAAEQKKITDAAKEAAKKRVRDNNESLREQEDKDGDDSAPAAKKAKVAEHDLDLDEAALAAGLNDGDIDILDDTSEPDPEQLQDKDVDESGSGTELDFDNDEAHNNIEPDVFCDNGITMGNDADTAKPASKLQKGFSRSVSVNSTGTSTPSTRFASPASVPSAATANRRQKLNRNDFSDNVDILATKARDRVRQEIALEGPNCNPSLSTIDWTWNIIKKTVVEHPNDMDIITAFEEVKRTTIAKDHLVTYVGYSRGGFQTHLIKKAQDSVAKHYNLNNKETAGKYVTWLKNKSNFLYAQANAENETKLNRPFCNLLIRELAQEIWFTVGRAKADNGAMTEIIRRKAVSISCVILIATAIEHAIGEYSTGTRIQADFQEVHLIQCYGFYLGSWKKLGIAASTFAQTYPALLYSSIFSNCNIQALMADEGDISEFDAEDLNNLVTNGEALF
ncbi:hypothetical protein CPB83DRAFT_900356 [Crepidotus variabilis]|uniref:DUF6532 domain-containing protein n=1 Tax=Crepidotus variabilis TaxID=179855 RepID=A0A9P6JI30_9AGAR|nr:hypothetical protein CPB83DRAFT_900356 [Crepidotus variabilis]